MQQSPEPVSESPSAEVVVPSWRPVTDISEVPDSSSRGVKPTSPDGHPTEIMGLTLTVPEGSKFVDTEDNAGVPVTQVEFPDAVNTVPRVRVSHIEKLGTSVVHHSYAQESVLMMEGGTYVRRTEEEWPGASEAYLMTWETAVQTQDGSELPLSAMAFWLGDGQGGVWVLVATAPQGEMESSGLWDVVLSARLP